MSGRRPRAVMLFDLTDLRGWRLKGGVREAARLIGITEARAYEAIAKRQLVNGRYRMRYADRFSAPIIRERSNR